MEAGESFPQNPEFSHEELEQLVEGAREMHRLYHLGTRSTELPVEEEGITVTVHESSMPTYHHDDTDSIAVIAMADSPFVAVHLISKETQGDLQIKHGVSLNLTLPFIDNPMVTHMDIPVHQDGSALTREEQEATGFSLVANLRPVPLQRDEFSKMRQYIDEALNLFRQLG